MLAAILYLSNIFLHLPQFIDAWAIKRPFDGQNLWKQLAINLLLWLNKRSAGPGSTEEFRTHLTP
jgi:hypothetical protein